MHINRGVTMKKSIFPPKNQDYKFLLILTNFGTWNMSYNSRLISVVILHILLFHYTFLLLFCKIFTFLVAWLMEHSVFLKFPQNYSNFSSDFLQLTLLISIIFTNNFQNFIQNFFNFYQNFWIVVSLIKPYVCAANDREPRCILLHVLLAGRGWPYLCSQPSTAIRS